ncbi:hypothetical protein XELAEV_18006743mg [Xenopus laevis]|uniref:Ribitol-5-phosphate transferase FKTN N-terminal domain-containing protein n=1 Tax=Xenopus laevis TaxID=8355 RepID=A0A974DZU8_XENLA|nr:hypothetical protein XELAEV_18006743mg [Xenopus laevis]
MHNCSYSLMPKQKISLVIQYFENGPGFSNLKGIISSQETLQWVVAVFVVNSALLQVINKDLEQLKSTPGIQPQCHCFCEQRDVTTFGLQDALWESNENFFQVAEKMGFQWQKYEGRDPRLEGMEDLQELILITTDQLKMWIPKEPSAFLRKKLHSRFLECRYKEAQSFFQLYPDDYAFDAIEFRMHAKRLLHLAALTMGNIGVTFWLSSGTCLAFHKAGLQLTNKFGKVEDSLELSFIEKHNGKLDIFFFYEEENYMWNGGTQAKSGKKFKLKMIFVFVHSVALNKSRYLFPKFTLCWTEFEELKVQVPCEAKEYVEANYGKNWDVPVKDWDWKNSPPNVQPNGMWPVDEFAEVMQIY